MDKRNKNKRTLTTEYVGSVYIGVVGPEDENGECRDSIQNIIKRNGDAPPRFIRATKGYEARQMHLDDWYEQTKHEFLLLLDHDMVFPSDALERLRAHKKPYLSGYYLRRRFAPVAPVWYEPNPQKKFPMQPMARDPERGKLHEIGASGWGCLLMHREVVTAVRPLLKGEAEIIEDDMDVYPYSAAAMVRAIGGIRMVLNERPHESTLYPALEAHTKVLEKEFRVLRGVKDVVGSDVRFPFFAREAGFVLYGDPDVRCDHMLNYPLNPDDFSGMTNKQKADLAKTVMVNIQRERKRVRQQVRGLRGGGNV